MTDQRLLQILINNREWQSFECKRAAVQPGRLLEAVIAFANTEGGVLVVGLDDPDKEEDAKKRLVGISENLDNVSEFLKLIDKEIEPPLRLWKKIELKISNSQNQYDKLLIVVVEKTNDVHSLKKGDTYTRKGRQNVKIGSSEIIRLKYAKGTLHFEDEDSEIKGWELLDGNLLRQYQKDTQSESEDGWQFLKDNGLATTNKGENKLTKAGVLLFGKNPSVSLKNKCGIKISHYYGKKPTFSGEPNFVRRPFTIEGPVINQIKKTLNYFKEVVKSSPPKLAGSVFTPSLLIPEWAFQEAITNAVIHRDYFMQDDIQVRFFDDRIEVESPGTYPGHITVSNIRSERFSRNPIIQRTLNRFQSAPNLDIGEGVDRIFRIMRENNLYEPLFMPPDVRPNSVLLILFNLQKVEYWDTINQYISRNYRITNIEAREISGISDTLKMSRLLKGWVEKGLLEQVGGKSKKSTYYIKPGQDLPRDLFSIGDDNKS